MNKRIIVNRQKRRKRRQMMIRNILRVAVPTVLLSLLICFLIWKFVLPGNGSGGSSDESQEVLLGDEYETVTGAGTESEGPAQAARMPLKGPRDDAKTTILTPGWHDDKTGRWYQNPDRTYFSDGFEEIDGVQYYFDRDGYLHPIENKPLTWDPSTVIGQFPSSVIRDTTASVSIPFSFISLFILRLTRIPAAITARKTIHAIIPLSTLLYLSLQTIPESPLPPYNSIIVAY